MLIQAAIEGQGVAVAKATLAGDDLKAGRLVRPFDQSLPANYSYGDFPDGQPFYRQAMFKFTPGATNSSALPSISVSINEWMADNATTLVDPASLKHDDWFEIYNPSNVAANLGGYFLTDTLTNQFQFQIPAGYTIPPHSFIVVWADGKITNGTPELHVSFKMSKAGESLGLYGADGTPVDFVNYGAQSDDVSEGRFPDGGPYRFFMPTPTPRTNNVIPNTAPVLDPIANKFVHFGQTLHFTATAADAEGTVQTLTFSLDPGFPAGATFEVVYRDTDQPNWTSVIPAGDVTTIAIPISKDNVIFGVRSVDAAGHRSAAVYPIPPPRTRPVPGTTPSTE